MEVWQARKCLPKRAQTAGRDPVFAGYRLRVAEVLRDYGMTDRAEAPADSREFHIVGEKHV